MQAALFLFVKGFRQFKAADAESVSAHIGACMEQWGEKEIKNDRDCVTFSLFLSSN